jgi:hypothetical protein
MVVGGGLFVGGLTSIGQGTLPEYLGPMANSAGSWSVAAFGLAAINRNPRFGALLGASALFAMVLGYALVSELRGYPSGSRLVLFWGAAAVVVGPAIGVAAAWVRGTDVTRVAIAAGLVGGILIGEGVYGLVLIGDTTPIAYWAGQVLIGVVITVGVAASRLHWNTAAGLSGLVALIVAASVFGVYAANPIQFLA